jgi:hypothetical protein
MYQVPRGERKIYLQITDTSIAIIALELDIMYTHLF